MKKHIKVCTAILLAAKGVVAQPVYPFLNNYSAVTGNNFVRTYVPQRATTNTSDISLPNQPAYNCVVNTQYYDGIGRPLQEVLRNGRGDGALLQEDIVTVHTYDNTGKEQVKCLPYSKSWALTSTAGKLKTTPTDLVTQYNILYPGQPAYNQTVFDNSPLNRVVSTCGAGSAWVGSGNCVTIQYTTNAYTDQVPFWTVGSAKTDQPTFVNYYGDGKLFVTKTTDEDGHIIYEYKDMMGHVVLKKQKIGATYAMTSYAYDDFGRLRWVISPEAFSQGIVFATATVKSQILAGLCYNYFYDKRGRLVEKTEPGKEVEYYIYDRYDRVVLRQDGNLRQCGTPIYTGGDDVAPAFMPVSGGSGNEPNQEEEWNRPLGRLVFPPKVVDGPGGPPILDPPPTPIPDPVYNEPPTNEATGSCGWYFTFYDALDRVLMTGVYLPYYNNSRENLQRWLDNGLNLWGPNYLLYNLYHDQYQVYPNCLDAKIWTMNYYDNYENPALISPTYYTGSNSKLTGTGPYAIPPTTQNSMQLRGLQTGSSVAVLNPGGFLGAPYGTPWLRNVNLYDDKARLLQVISKNHCNGLDIVTNQYSFAGHLLSSVLHSWNPLAEGFAGAPASAFNTTDIIKDFTVDYYNGKPRGIVGKINAEAAQSINRMDYDIQGRLQSKGQNVVSNRYSYNVQGWLTGINENFFNTSASDVFWCEKLVYNDPLVTSGISPSPPLSWGGSTSLNGNITGWMWKNYNKEKRAYAYNYDDLNRVRNAWFSAYLPVSGTPTWTNSILDYTMSGVTYDLNGNIKTMNQRGNKTGSAPVDMDLLTYDYPPYSNQLKGVADAASITTANPDFKDDPAHGTNDYAYDRNGNLTIDRNKGIGGTQYNHLNKPLQVDLLTAGKGVVNYVYDALGNKLHKRITNATDGKVTLIDYVGPFEYIKEGTGPRRLHAISHEEGRMRPVVSSTGAVSYVYDYFVKDHLNDVRAIVTSNFVANSITVVPFSYGTGGATAAYRATHETSMAQVEEELFMNIPAVRAEKPASISQDDIAAAELDGTDPNKRIGTSKLMRVMPGSQLSLSAETYYEDPSGGIGADDNELMEALLTSLAGGGAYEGRELSEIPQNIQLLQNGFSDPNFIETVGSLMNNNYSQNAPAAFLNYVVFDDQMQVVPGESGSIQIGAGAGQWQTIGTPINIDISKSGYVLVFASSKYTSKVYFDRINLGYYKGAQIEENHYYPFGLNIEINSEDFYETNDIKFMSKELQHKEFSNGVGFKTGLEYYDFGARMYDPQIGRWNSMDPLASKAPSLTPYNSMWNNPVKNLDPDGKWPWNVNVRSFISTSTTGGGTFYADNRGPAFDGTSRVRSSFTVDPSASVVTQPRTVSDPTVFFGTIPPTVKVGDPTGSNEHISVDGKTASFDFSHSGKDPVTPGLVTPALDVHGKLSFSEDLKNGILSITGTFTGDKFPSTESFIKDASGKTTIFLGAVKEKGNVMSLYGDNSEKLFNVNMQVLFDNKGNATGVKQGKTTYTIEQWNTKVTASFDEKK